MNGPNSTKLSRRQFLKQSSGYLAAGFASGAGAAAVGKWVYDSARQRPGAKIPGEMLGASAALGHRLRQGAGFPQPRSATPAHQLGVLIIGGGVAGLSAGWTLARRGFGDFALLELEAEAGGNARYGENEISRYPWGAHYLPIPNRESESVHELLRELRVMKEGVLGGAPTFEEQAICAAPSERLYLHGEWQEGLLPTGGLRPSEAQELHRFQAEMESFRQAIGSDGRPAFAIPSRLSSRDPKFLALDRLTFGEWLSAQGYRSEALLWYVDYCCRDDYGARARQISAWAGIHYFASRRGWASGVSGSQVLTWPEGNGYLIQALRTRLAAQVVPNRVVFEVRERTEGGGGFEVLAFDARRGESERWWADAVILATPRFVTSRIFAPLRGHDPAGAEVQYAPWMVANLSVRDFDPGHGASLSWDNVLYRSQSLGYIHAKHQNLERYATRDTVLTHYWALADAEPSLERQGAYRRSRGEWLEWIVRDLQRAHPEIEKQLLRADVWLWGHAMAIPKPGQLLSGQPARLAQAPRGVEFAHSDLSGLSIFEEAQDQGVQAALRTLRRLHGARSLPA